MDIQKLLTGIRWDIVQSLSRSPKSTSELAKELNTSAANISQQLRQLELVGLLTKKRSHKPDTRHVHIIDNSVTSLLTINRRITARTAITDPYRAFCMQLLLEKHGFPVLAMLLSHDALFQKLEAVCYLRRKHPEVLVVTESVDEIRKNTPNITITHANKQRKIVLWSHTQEELQQGVKNRETYFRHLIIDGGATYDPESIIKPLFVEVDT